MGIFFLGWLLFTMILTRKYEKVITKQQISIDVGTKRSM